MKELNFEKELKRLSKSEYIIHNEGEKGKFEYVARKIVNIILILMIVLLCVEIASWIGKECCRFSGFNSAVNSENIGDYLSLFGTHCSVVFLTTSLMTMLSEKSKFVYHVDLVELVLINPLYYNFKTLVVYAMSSILWAMFGFLVKDGAKIIGGFIFGVVALVVLFWRMILIYYRRESHKNKIRRFVTDIVKLTKKIEKEEYQYREKLKEYNRNREELGEYNRNREKLKEYNKQRKELEKISCYDIFEKIINEALKELANNNILPVIEALELLEESIMLYVGDTYDNDESSIEKTYNVISSKSGLPHYYTTKTKIYLEYIYIDFASAVAIQKPSDVEQYYHYSKKIIPNTYLKMIRSFIFPYILNHYIAGGEKQKFFICLNQWDKLNGFFPAIKKYLVSIALDGKSDYLAEYYDNLAYSAARDLDIAIAANEPNSGIGYWISEKSYSWTLFRKHEKILEYVYNESVEAFENILSYKKNRKYFMQVFTCTDEGGFYWDHLDECICLSETVLYNREPESFLRIFNKLSEDLLLTGYEDRKKDFVNIVGKIVDVDGMSVIKTNKDVEYLLEHIYRSICSDEGDQIYILFYEKSEKELKQHSVRMLELYEKALEDGVDLLENRSTHCDKKDDLRNTVDRIKILQTLLDKIKAEREN